MNRRITRPRTRFEWYRWLIEFFNLSTLQAHFSEDDSSITSSTMKCLTLLQTISLMTLRFTTCSTKVEHEFLVLYVSFSMTSLNEPLFDLIYVKLIHSVDYITITITNVCFFILINLIKQSFFKLQKENNWCCF